MHVKNNADRILAHLIYILENNLAELTSAKPRSEYVIGSWEANIECLEIIGCWSRAKNYGLDYNPEVKFNIYK